MSDMERAMVAPCSVCKAEVGSPCIVLGTREQITLPHGERLQDAEELTKADIANALDATA